MAQIDDAGDAWLCRLSDVKQICDISPPSVLSAVRPILSSFGTVLDGNEVTVEELVAVQKDIYKQLTANWFGKRTTGNNEANQTEHCLVYCRNLAARMLATGNYLVTEEETIEPSLLTITATDKQDTDEDFIKQIRDCCVGLPLARTLDGAFQFSHQSFIRFFGSPEQLDLTWSYNIHVQVAGSVHQITLGKRSNPIGQEARTLATYTQTNPEFENLLIRIVRATRTNFGLDELAAASLSTLNHSGFNFTGQDFQDIYAPGADMSGSFCDHTDFRGSYLRGADFTQAYMPGARFEGCDMGQTRFGEEAVAPVDGKLLGLNTYHTPTSTLLFCWTATVNKYVEGQNLDRHDRVTLHVTDFVTGQHVVSKYFGRFKFGRLSHQIVEDKNGNHVNSMYSWPHKDGRLGYWAQVQSIRKWNLSTWSYTWEPVKKYFPAVKNTTAENWADFDVSMDPSGQWIAICSFLNLETSDNDPEHVLIARMGVEDQDPIRYNVPTDGHHQTRIHFAAPDVLAVNTKAGKLILLGLNFETRRIATEVTIDRSTVGPIVEIPDIFKGQGQKHLIQTPTGRWEDINFVDTSSGIITELEVPFKFPTHAGSMKCNEDLTLMAVGDSTGSVHVWRLAGHTEGNVNPPQLIRSYAMGADSAPTFCFHGRLLATSQLRQPVIRFWEIPLASEVGVTEVYDPHSEQRDPPKEPQINKEHVIVALSVHVDKSKNQHRVQVACLYSDQQQQWVGTQSKQEVTLGLWTETNDRGRPRFSPTAVSVGKVLGTNLAMAWSDEGEIVLVATLGTKWESAASWLLFYGLTGQAGPISLLAQVPIVHQEWRGRTTHNYRSALQFLDRSGHGGEDDVNLATVLWDGSVQLWRITGRNLEPLRVVECRGERKDFTYLDPFNQTLFSIDDLKNDRGWVYVQYIRLFGDWLLTSDQYATGRPYHLIRVWHLPTHSPSSPPLMGATRKECIPLSIHFNPDSTSNKSGALFWCSLSLSQTSQLKVSDKPTESKVVPQILTCSDGVIAGDSRTRPELRWTVTGDKYGGVQLWDSGSTKVVLEIPVSFPVFAVTVQQETRGAHPEEPSVLSVFVGGLKGNLVLICINTEKLTWSLETVLYSSRKVLIVKDCSISQSLRLTNWGKRILQSQGAVGEPSPLMQDYIRFNQLLRPLPLSVSSSINLKPGGQHEHPFGLWYLSQDRWVVSIASRAPQSRLGKFEHLIGLRHLFFILQGYTSDGELFATRADLRCHPITGRVLHRLVPYTNMTTYERDMKAFEGEQHWEISPRCGLQLLSNVRREQQQEWDYDFFLHNCVFWCHQHLISVGIPSTYWQLVGKRATIAMLGFLLTMAAIYSVLHELDMNFLSSFY